MRTMESLKKNLYATREWFQELSAVYIINEWYDLPSKYNPWISNWLTKATFTGS